MIVVKLDNGDIMLYSPVQVILYWLDRSETVGVISSDVPFSKLGLPHSSFLKGL